MLIYTVAVRNLVSLRPDSSRILKPSFSSTFIPVLKLSPGRTVSRRVWRTQNVFSSSFNTSSSIPATKFNPWNGCVQKVTRIRNRLAVNQWWTTTGTTGHRYTRSANQLIRYLFKININSRHWLSEWCILKDTTLHLNGIEQRCFQQQTRKPSYRWQTRATQTPARNCSNSTCLQRCRWQYWPIFIRLTVVASEICEILKNSLKIQTYEVQGHPRSSILVPIESPYVTCY